MKKIIKLFIIFALLISSYCICKYNTINAKNTSLQPYQIEINKKSQTMSTFEVESLRTETTKHFYLEDGSFEAVEYGVPVHKKNSQGLWVDIDNKIIESKTKFQSLGNYLFFEKNDSSKPLIMYQKDNLKIECYISDLEIKSSLFQNTNKLISTLNYKMNDSDISFDFSLDQLKTNIETSRSTIAMIFKTKNIYIEKNENGLMFFDSDTSKIIYQLLTPYMMKEDTEISLTYKFLQIDEDTYSLEVENNEGNIVMPLALGNDIIIINPGYESGSGNEEQTFFDTYISKENPSTNYGTSTSLVLNNDNIVYMKTHLPYVADGSFIRYAYLSIPYYFEGSDFQTFKVGAYEVLENWEELTLTWNSIKDSPNYGISTEASADGVMTSAVDTEGELNRITLDIAKAAQDWYSRTISYYGIALKCSTTTTNTCYISSWETGEEWATFTVKYYTSNVLVKDGTYYIKNYSLKNYMQIDNDDKPDYTTDGAIIELWGKNEEDHQKWYFEYLHNGYYLIKNIASGKVLTIAEGDENVTGKALIQSIYTGSYRQQWRVCQKTIYDEDEADVYYFVPRCGDNNDNLMCMGAGSGFIITGGRNVEQKPYVRNDNTIRWTVEKVE